MKFTIRAAHRRADAALALGVIVALLSALPAIAYNRYADESTRPSASSAPIVVIDSPVELAVAALGAEQLCLAEAMYYEARGEGLNGQKAIAEVILQRTHDGNYPRTICGVVHDGAKRHTGCQFSFTCDGSMKRPKNAMAWRRVRQLAQGIMEGAVRLGALTGRATHFHTVNVQPIWAGGLMRTAQIGNHIFYRRDFTRGS